MARSRNQPCPCGSGKKFKACCAARRSPSQWLALVSVVLFAALAVWVVAGVLRKASTEDWDTPPPGKVWSEEHGHWHDAPGQQQQDDVTPQGGPAPPGKVWSAEHGHWHDATPFGAEAAPDGPAPPGKVWSEEHGHWHDAAGEPGVATDAASAGAAPPGPAPPGKVWSEEHGHWHDADGGLPELPPLQESEPLPEQQVSDGS